MKKIYKKQIIGLTGSGGILGKYFVKNYKKKFIFKPYKGRVENIINFKNWVKKNRNIDLFLHFAALTSVRKCEENSQKAFLINTKSTIRILEILNKSSLKNLKYFLFISTSHVYKPSLNPLSEEDLRYPKTVYGKSKKLAEDYIMKRKKIFYFKIGIARIFNFYSMRQKNGFFITDILNKLRRKQEILNLKKINTYRDYIGLKDICEIIIFILKKKPTEPINIGSGYKVKLISLVKQLIKAKNFKTKLIYDEIFNPGYVANINFLRKIGYKKKINKFMINKNINENKINL